MSVSRGWFITLSALAVVAGTWSPFAIALQSPAVPTSRNPSSQNVSGTPVASATGETHGWLECDANSHIEQGKQIEPRATQDQPVSKFREIYGKESKRDRLGPLTWNLRGYSLTDGYFNSSKLSEFVSITVKPGNALKTIDGIELGVDTFATVLKKLQARGIEVHESMDGPEGNWMLFVSFYSPCNRKFRAEYSWIIPGGPNVDRQIIPDLKGSASQPVIWRSDIFLDRVAYNYSLQMSHGSDLALGSQLSTHK